MATDPEYRAHQEWLGFLQPEGLVVSPPALCAAQAHVNRNIAPTQQVLIDLVQTEKVTAGPDRRPAQQAVIPDLRDFCLKFLGWQITDLIGANGQVPESLQVGLSEYGETLKPDYAIPDPDNPGKWLLLVKTVDTGADFDAAEKSDGHQWHASAQARFERLLRETEIPVGLLFNGTHLRLTYAPRGESSGYLTFPVQAMCEVAGRPIVAALHMLLSADRLFAVPTAQRLPAVLRESRKYQNEVSTTLAEQVLAALNELLRGFQAANEAAQGELLKDALSKDPNHIYGGLLASLMRMVFILYAEDRSLLPLDSVFINNYSVAELFLKLREDNARFPDTMDQRYGAWAQLLTLFRLIYDGAAHGSMRLPARHGKLFDPDEYPFLEGRPYGSRRQSDDVLKPPRVSDGVIYRVLSNLLLLDGERISYRTLDVEQIGSVYEAMMGFELQVATGPSVGLRPDNVVVNLEEVMKTEGDNRAKLIRDVAGCELIGQALEQLKAATNIDDLVSALGKRISGHSAYVVPKGGMFLQPTDERRRSGSHYTPRSLTEPIVRTAFRPIFDRLGPKPRMQEILDLKVCDPAMGSGAFLVEACRVLGDKLVEAWQVHGDMPAIPPDEDPQLYARRVVAQRCLYGVDKNPFAVDLAKLSLWLATLAKDHPFTFLDHALRCGDSLVGLSKREIAQFHWNTSVSLKRLLGQDQLEKTMERVMACRREILSMVEDNEATTLLKQQKLDVADQALTPVRRAGDLLIAAFFNGSKEKEREALRKQYFDTFVSASRGHVPDLEKEYQLAESVRQGNHPLRPFHWEMEFPEVFERDNAGFDVFVGNPPFMGGSMLSEHLGKNYSSYLLTTFEEARGKADLVGFFFRRVFMLMRQSGTAGLVATKTIAQGDTRFTSLRYICQHGGIIFEAIRRLRWPAAEAAVIVSVVHLSKTASLCSPARIDGAPVQRISAYLVDLQIDSDPSPLRENDGFVYSGSNINGRGFVLTVRERTHFGEVQAACLTYIKPYLTGDDINNGIGYAPSRFVIDFGDADLAEVQRCPVLYDHLFGTVRLQRQSSGEERLRERWWQHSRPARDLYARCKGLEHLLAASRHSEHLLFVFQPTNIVFSDAVTLFAFDDYASFAILQSRVHEIWARFFGSSLGDTLRYIPEDCFQTFPFPRQYKGDSELERIGREYYEFRDNLLHTKCLGLTDLLNQFHDRDNEDTDIRSMRRLQAELDRSVLHCHGWDTLNSDCIFELSYQEHETDDMGTAVNHKQPWRYRWPQKTRDEVLAHLLKLNRQRTLEEAIAGQGISTSRQPKPSKRRVKEKSLNAGPIVPGLLNEENQ